MHLYSLAPAVAATGVDVTVICQDQAAARLFARVGVPSVVAPVRSKWDVSGLTRLRPLLSADIVHTHDRRGALYVLPVARSRGAFAVHTYHGLPEALAVLPGRSVPSAAPALGTRERLRGFGLLRLEALAANQGATIVPSKAMAEFLLAHEFPGSRMYIVPSGIDARRSAPVDHVGSPIIATAGILEPHKRIDVLLHAAARCGTSHHIDVYGDGSLRDWLEREARRLRLNVTFHGQVTDLRERLEGADVFVLPSDGENLPIAILEAMAAALPVVATRVGGVSELVVDGETGVLVEPGDVDSMVTAISRLLEDQALRRRYGVAGATRVGTDFNIHSVAKATVDVYRRVLGTERRLFVDVDPGHR
jgi:glycosyltransferase involved in cell wall biosynthesis